MTWNYVPLGRLATKIGSGATPTGGQQAYKSSGVPFVRSMNVRDGEFDPTGMAFLDESQARALDQVTLAADGVLLNITGASVARVCKLPAQYAGGRVNQHVAIIRTQRGKLYPDYLKHCLLSPQIKQALLTIAGSGATREAITKASIERFAIPLPPIDEQKRIAAILDQADELRRKRQTALRKLDEMAHAIFVGKFGDLRTNSRGWAVAPVSHYVASFQGGKSLESDTDNVSARNRVLKVSAVTEGVFKPEECKPLPDAYVPPKEHFVRSGDLLFSRANTTELVGAVAYVAKAPDGVVLPDKLWRFVWKEPQIVMPLFVWSLFRMPAIREEIGRRASGTSGSMKNISQAKLLSMPTILPPLERQREFSESLRMVHRLQVKQKASAAALDALFSSLQHRAFHGELIGIAAERELAEVG
jgi:type I restriction enzyme S subunit